MNRLTYLFSILLFCGPALFIIWKNGERVLKKYEVLLFYIILISIPVTFTDYFALKWGAWYYYPAHTLNVYFLTELETYIFTAIVALGVASAMLVFAARIDGWNRKKTKAKPRRKRSIAKY